MKFLEILEKGWLAAAVIAVVMGIFNLATRMKFDNLVYMPIMCCGFCVLIYMNIRGQRRFAEKMKNDLKKKPDEPKGE